jgi:hypothetical protein
MTLRLASILLAVFAVACHPNRPAIGSGQPTDVGGSIAGMVATDGGATALSARKVTAINVGTGARYDVSTASNGGYTVRVPAGTYRLELELKTGEALVTSPEVTDVDRGDLDAGRDFVIAVAAR